jgi:hypothetical protein
MALHTPLLDLPHALAFVQVNRGFIPFNRLLLAELDLPEFRHASISSARYLETNIH